MSPRIGPYTLKSPVILAPMAGVTDQPFRLLCMRLGAGMVVAEMLTCDTSLWQSRKSSLRLIHQDEPEPRSVQIAGNDPDQMAEAARLCVERGAQIVDINMGCPAKKVCKKAAGSALLKDEVLVRSILKAVVAAVDVPVTLKIRTGWSPDQRNGLTIARIAEDTGIQALAVHGRTRACGFKGKVEYDTIAQIKEAVSIPVFANGDITTPLQAVQILRSTGADGIMIGRAAQGNPWIFREIAHFLESGETLPAPAYSEMQEISVEHLHRLHDFYGEHLGVRIARKHLGWYVQHLPLGAQFRSRFNTLETPADQLASAQDYFEQLIEGEVMAA
ncbi:MAG: tRNA dihydrouridine synthase DusB [Gammaproteobacteria bacterium]|nr:tRNA dihydrouridine synthase DusB [Gammaproteobacteria bacterium]